MSSPFSLAWSLLKGDYDTDMATAETMTPDAQLAPMQSYYSSPWGPAPFGQARQGAPSPEDYAANSLSQSATSQGVHGANIGEPNFNTSQGHSSTPIMRNAIEANEHARDRAANPLPQLTGPPPPPPGAPGGEEAHQAALERRGLR